MNEKRLLNQRQSPIECELLTKLYPDSSTSRVRELRAQYRIDKYDDVPVTITDFAFYCRTGYKTTMGMGQTRRQGIWS